jgi:NitT/TauT family transport system ATP-binding protein
VSTNETPAAAVAATAGAPAEAVAPSPSPSAPAAGGEAAAPAAPLPPAPPPPIVSFDKVGKTYADGFTAIRDVTFSIEDKPNEMEFITILGPSGCGKSTILRLIAGLPPQHPATTGSVLVLGRPVQGPGADRGMVFQDYTSFDNRTVEDNVAFGLECQGMPAKERRARARDWIGKVGLDVDRDAQKYPHQLSGGMRQRVAIARSLILQPKILLMDEPFGALDPRTRLNMQDLLVSLTREAQATVFFVTHSIEEAVYLGDRTFIISSAPGTILKQMPVPPPDFPAREMQRQPEFMQIVFGIREIMEQLESSTRAGDE